MRPPAVINLSISQDGELINVRWKYTNAQQRYCKNNNSYRTATQLTM